MVRHAGQLITDGESEEIVGKALKGRRDEVVLAAA
jgi:aryl-alcohol dehydrogenase-like predicted oxidoreductase